MLRRVCSGPAEVDDVIQETYYKVLEQGKLDHVLEPKGFLVRIARNIVFDRMRRDAVVSIESVANLEELDMADSAPSTERVALARAELRWVFGLIANLPERCKEVFTARRIYGLSQAETAESLQVSEGVVEQESMRGMRLISDMIARVGVQETPARKQPTARKRHVHDR
ncbi:sigma-70 family RNA polymerase sigma factor [Duganella sp. FT92W]|uniref:Sigma-70 family RNA polymerase sigma factor n=2 Tax=Pseudoduganella rivuli TaxID=2666085 RepID=A0A7X2IPS1_9BURK|nr:sigma-70 family RNA polymerase sigma factor [Pseudoduganella rivuli]